MRIGGTPRVLDAVLARFRTAFSDVQYEHFRRYTAGLVLSSGPRTVLGISRLYLDPPDQSVLNRFLADPRWSRSRLAHLRRALVADLAATQQAAESFLIIDDTTIERASGYCVEGIGFHHAGTGNKRTVRGHCIVTSHLAL